MGTTIKQTSVKTKMVVMAAILALVAAVGIAVTAGKAYADYIPVQDTEFVTLC